MRPRKYLFVEAGLLLILALPAVGCGGRSDLMMEDPGSADGGLQDPSCGWSRVWSDPAAPNDCTWHYELDGDPVRCAGFPLGSGTPEECQIGCGHDKEGDPAETCTVGQLGDGSYELSCSAPAGGQCAQ